MKQSRFATKALTSAILLTTLAMPVTDARAAQASNLQKMKFEVYAGGVNAVTANLLVDMRKDGRYRMMFGAKTQGLLGSMVPWKGTFESDGWVIKHGEYRPELHESVASWMDEVETKSYRYKRDGSFVDLTTKYTTKKPKVKIPDEKLTKDTTDVLAATLTMMSHVAQGNDCNGTADIFDGKRRFAMEFRHQRYVMIKPTRYNIYDGTAIECVVEVTPKGGRWHKKPRGWLSIQEQGRDQGKMPTVWFAIIGDENIAVPVRVRVKTDYGTLFMHLTEYESGDIKLTGKK